MAMGGGVILNRCIFVVIQNRRCHFLFSGRVATAQSGLWLDNKLSCIFTCVNNSHITLGAFKQVSIIPRKVGILTGLAI